MAPSFAEIVQSDLFTFHVGTGEKKDARQTYSKAIAATSDKMRALIEGGMLESGTRSAELEGVMAEDFDRYYEFAMRGDYTIPPWNIDEPVVSYSPSHPYIEEAAAMPEQDAEKPAEAPLDEESWGYTSRKANIKRRFDSRNYLTVSGPKDAILHGFTPQSNTSANQDFKPIFLAHARMYTFADMQLAYPLKQLALHKLHRTLVGFRLFSARIGDIIELVRYAYDHNMDRKEDDTVDELRQLVVGYVTSEIGTIGRSKEWEALIEEGGEFVVDFWRVLRDEQNLL